jgi:hypothetical protein
MYTSQYIITFFENYSNCVAGCPFFKKQGESTIIQDLITMKRLKPLISAYLIL